MLLVELIDNQMNAVNRFQPDSMQISLKADPCSTATMVLSENQPGVNLGDWVRVTAPNGEVNVMYVKSIQNEYLKKTRTVSLEHTFALLKDYVSFGKTVYNNKSAYAVIRNQLSYQELWTMGTVDYTVSQPWEFNNSTIGDNLEDIAECCQDSVWVFDQSVMPWLVSLKQLDTTVKSEMRLSRNINGVNINIDRSNMYTRIYPVGAKNIDIKSVNNGVEYLDMNTSQYGIISRVVTEQGCTTPANLLSFARAELKRNAQPGVSINIDGLLMTRLTGSSFDNLKINDTCRVILHDYGITHVEKIVELNWQDAVKDEMAVKVTLSNNRQTLSSIVKKEKKRSSKGGTRSGCDMQDADEEIKTIQGSYAFLNDEKVGQVIGKYTYNPKTKDVQLVDGAISYVRKDPETGQYESVDIVGTVDDMGVLKGTKVWSNRTEVGNMVTNTQGKYCLRTRLEDSKYVVQYGDLTRNPPSFAVLFKVTTKGVDLGDFATVTSLNATKATISNLTSGNSTASWLVSNHVTVSSESGFKLGSHTISKKAIDGWWCLGYSV